MRPRPQDDPGGAERLLRVAAADDSAFVRRHYALEAELALALVAPGTTLHRTDPRELGD